ncbi:response regulator transcription factor [Paenibacillus tundrae]|uniref:Two-component system response regulator YesN n=1 Tax=Paenibacillus tundrae TaxID=528187 RepID=A0ABT9WIZ7_9BACL|nr:response regulator transcription factor [Paenibacillus tundrae]MDQ0173234.1 two-component system response regulator YesN [Paenibacillus tundrae]
MYRVFLVDDEPSIREGLTTIINWEEYGFEVIGTAASGREAIERFDELKPDLTIIDIRMPGMTGLDVIEEVREHHADAHFLILSGYADFDYAKKAISFGVDGYLLKPVDEEEIISELQRISVVLTRERETNARHAGEDTAYREHQIEALLFDNQEGAVTTQEDALGLKWLQYQIILLEIHAAPDLQRGSALKRKLIEAFDQQQRGIVFSFHSGLGLLCKEPIISIDGARNVHDELRSLLGEWNIHMYVAAGQPVPSTAEISKSYRQANAMLADRFLFSEERMMLWNDQVIGENHIHSTEDSRPDGFEPDEAELADKMYYALDIRSHESVMRVLTEMQDRIVPYHRTEQAIKTAFSQIFSLAINKLAAANQQMQSILQEHSMLITEVYHQHTLRDLQVMAAEHLNRLIQRMGGGSTDTVLKQMIEFIRRNPGENLKLEVLSDVFNYNSSYLGKLFKNHTGESFNAFLDKVRMEKAKELLNEGLKVHQVAARVGYANVDYFHGKFRKYVGESPSAYKHAREHTKLQSKEKPGENPSE